MRRRGSGTVGGGEWYSRRRGVAHEDEGEWYVH